MAKIYSDEEIERLSKNPCVSHVSRHRLSLALDFKQYMYDVWIEKPVPSTIRRLLLENGFDTREIGKDFYKNISNAFRHWGRPKRVRGPAYNEEDVRFPVKSEKSEESDTPGTRWHSNGAQSELEAVQDALVRSGKFVMDGGTIDFAPHYVAALFASYPEEPLAEALSRDGFDPWEVGGARIHKLEKMFALCRSAGTAPYESRGDACLLESGEAEALRRNPFVAEASPSSIIMSEGFYLSAAALKGLTVDQILDIYRLDHRNFTLFEKAAIKGRLDGAKADLPGVSAFGDTAYDACILRRRMDALAGIAEEGLGGIASIFPTLRPLEKKRVCLWVEGLPHDPGQVLTKKEVLKQAGISRSSYYQYVRDPAFGTREARKKERDEADAGIVRMAFDYKGFRKGARQVYMLLPRLAGRRIGLKRIRRIMKEGGMECGIRRPNPSRKGREAYEKESVKPDILRRRFRLYRPNRVRVTDVTYLDYGGGKRAYGSALMDPVTGRLFIVQ